MQTREQLHLWSFFSLLLTFAGCGDQATQVSGESTSENAHAPDGQAAEAHAPGAVLDGNGVVTKGEASQLSEGLDVARFSGGAGGSLGPLFNASCAREDDISDSCTTSMAPKPSCADASVTLRCCAHGGPRGAMGVWRVLARRESARRLMVL